MSTTRVPLLPLQAREPNSSPEDCSFELLRDVWEQIESTVIGVEEFGEVYVVDTMVGARGQQAIATDWHVYNVIWMREGLVIRRRVFINHAEAVETASS
ncbi:MAG: hypothetical protein JO342_18645 [Solirubrobacterales bacterium]|nr:hypothetical protein [Solirubrobacterales bacterium]